MHPLIGYNVLWALASWITRLIRRSS